VSRVLRLLRLVLGVQQPAIGREKALALARTYFEGQGVTVREPVVIELLRTWRVWARGAFRESPSVLLDQQTGGVLEVTPGFGGDS
jgi:hypothetical protein